MRYNDNCPGQISQLMHAIIKLTRLICIIHLILLQQMVTSSLLKVNKFDIKEFVINTYSE